MSGPKLSQAELERMRAEQLERERMAALKRLQEAQSAYRKECAKAGILKEKASQLLSRTDAVYRADAEVRVQAALDRIRIRPVADKKIRRVMMLRGQSWQRLYRRLPARLAGY